MSRVFQKFELLNLKGSIEQESFKIVRVDDISNSKEILQNTVHLLQSGRTATASQISEGIDVIQDIKTREGIELSTSGQTLFDDQRSNPSQSLLADNEVQKLLDSKLLSVNLLLKPGSSDAHNKLLNSYCSLIIWAQLFVIDENFRGIVEDFFNLLRDIFQEFKNNSLNKAPSVKSVPSRERESHQPKDYKEASKNIYSQTSYENCSRIVKTSHEQENEKKDAPMQNNKRTAKSRRNHGSESNIDYVVNKTKEVDISSWKQTKYCNNDESSSSTRSQTQCNKKRNHSIGSIKSFGHNEDVLKILAHRLAGIINKIQSRLEYQNALEGLFDSLSNIKSNFETATNSNILKVKIYIELAEAVSNAKKAIEHFSGNYCLDTMILITKELNVCVDSDRKLQKIMKSNYQFIYNVIKDKKFFYDSQFNEKAIEQFNMSQYFFGSYERHIKRLLTEGTRFFRKLREDPVDNRTVSDLESLTKELFLDVTGGPTIKYDLLQNIHKFVPGLAQRLQQLEVPRITGEVDGFEYILDNISLRCGNILPQTVHVHTDTDFDTKQDRIMNVISVRVQDIQIAAQNITFYYKKNIMFSNIEDAGTINVTIDKGGLDVFFKFSTGNTSTERPYTHSNFVVLDSQCQVNNINVKFHQGKYHLLYKLFNKTIKTTIKRHIESLVSQSIREFMEESADASQQVSQVRLLDQLAKSLDPDAWGKVSLCSSR